MSEKEIDPAEVVKEFIRAMEVMDFDAALEHVDADVEYINSPDTTVHGHAGVRAVLEPFFAPILENNLLVLRQVVQGELVVLERLDRHRILQGWFELPVTGIFELKGGKISYWREYFDLATVKDAMEQLMGEAS
jgi:limonene-1,2-epoxide hydrolase